MPRKLLQKWLPHPRKVHGHRGLRMFGDVLQQQNLWHLNRRSVARAFAVGLFCAFLPIPAQMIAAAGIAIIVSANLPLSVVLVWLSNPITILPIFWFAYQVGALILGSPPHAFEFELSLSWLVAEFYVIGRPLLVGSLICGTVAAILGYVGASMYWRWYVIRIWQTRHKPKVEKVLHDILD